MKIVCHICDKETDGETLCQQCDEYTCQDCTVKFTQHNQIDYDLCEDCHQQNQDDFISNLDN